MRKPDAKTFNTGGASLAAALKRRPKAIPGGVTVPNSAWQFRGDDGYKTNAERNSIKKGLAFGEMENYDGAERTITGTSIFDPVLCELAYRWFCPPGGVVVDPFAGGSVRGIVAAKLGRKYHGVDLRAEQIEANRAQAAVICPENLPLWYCGDSRQIGDHLAGVEADFVFSYPPYADLEVYSEDPRDLSTMDYDEFRRVYAEIIERSCALLKPDRFACFVVGDVRGKDGMYYGFPWHTIDAFQRAGLRLYNEAVLVTAIGSLPIRAGKQFQASRKLGKSHQNVLVFCKGDPLKAVAAIGDVEFGEIEAETIDLGGALDAPADEDLSSDPWGGDDADS
jgi:DNA modification methylase